MRVRLLPREETRFFVESNSTICPRCSKIRKADKYAAGDPCPTCGEEVEERWHIVDIAGYDANGTCSCEFFQFRLEPIIVRLPAGSLERHRCSHIQASRDFALDVYLGAYARSRKEVNGA